MSFSQIKIDHHFQARSVCDYPYDRACFLRDTLIAQKNKATSYHLGLLKAKLAKLRRELIAPPGGGGGGAGVGFDVARTGIGMFQTFPVLIANRWVNSICWICW